MFLAPRAYRRSAYGERRTGSDLREYDGLAFGVTFATHKLTVPVTAAMERSQADGIDVTGGLAGPRNAFAVSVVVGKLALAIAFTTDMLAAAFFARFKKTTMFIGCAAGSTASVVADSRAWAVRIIVTLGALTVQAAQDARASAVRVICTVHTGDAG